MRAVQLPDSRAQSARTGTWFAGQLPELDADLVERQADLLGEHDEGDPPQHRPRIAAVPRTRALRSDQAPFLVEPQRGCRDAAAAGDLADRQQILHAASITVAGLDFKLTLTCRMTVSKPSARDKGREYS